MKDIELPPLPERDTSKPAEQQGLFRKFDVRRTDGSDLPSGKHYGCRYFVLDVDHDVHAAAALGAYANACQHTHPELAADLRRKWGAQEAPAQPLLSINGHQLLAALNFIAPDRTAEQLDTRACIQRGPARTDPDDNTVEGPGLFCWYSEYPEEGSIFLDEDRREAPAQAVQAVPDGWALVPEGATKEMVDASERIDWSDSDVRGNIHNMWNTMLASAPAAPLPAKECWCEACDIAQGNPLGRTRMSLCPQCGDKRCARAKHHSNECTTKTQEAAPAAQEPSADALDAKRYRFAADPQSDGYAVCEWIDGDWIPINSEDLDAAIAAQKEGASK